jgi:hypothetical protein
MRAAGRVCRADIDATATVRRGVVHTEIVDEPRVARIDLVLLGPPGPETTGGSICSGQVTSHVVDRTDRAVLVEQSEEKPPRAAESAEAASERDRRLVPAGAR